MAGASRTRSANGLWLLVKGLTSTAGLCFVSVMSSMFTIPERAASHGSIDGCTRETHAWHTPRHRIKRAFRLSRYQLHARASRFCLRRNGTSRHPYCCTTKIEKSLYTYRQQQKTERNTINRATIQVRTQHTVGRVTAQP